MVFVSLTMAAMRILTISCSINDRDWPVEKLKDVKVADALKHPNWNMGKKITVDSATLFNKVCYLFESVFILKAFIWKAPCSAPIYVIFNLFRAEY